MPTCAGQPRAAGVYRVLMVDRQWRPWPSPGAGAPDSTHQLDVVGTPHGSCPRWLIRYLGGAEPWPRGHRLTATVICVLCSHCGSTLASVDLRWAFAITLTLRNVY